MTESSDRSSTPLNETQIRPAASLAEVKIRRTATKEEQAAQPKAGDLTSALATPQPNAGTPESPAQRGGAPKPAAPDGPTLRQRLAAQRQAAVPPSPPSPPATPEDPPAPPTTSAAAGEAKLPADDGGNAKPGRKPSRNAPAAAPPSGRGKRRGSKDDSKKASDGAPKRSKDGSPDAVLRKRMQAVLKAETRRREQWEAKREESPPPSGRAGNPVAENQPRPAPTPTWSSPAKPVDIVRYWTSARRGRRLPALSELDLDEIAARWPDSLLLRFAAGSKYLELERSLSRNLGGGSDNPAPGPKIDYTPDVIDWVVNQGRAVTKNATPVRATEEFDTQNGFARYSVVALPLGEDGSTIDHILCHLEPA